MKKIIVSILVCAMFLTFVTSVKAYTMDDLYTQIQSLQKQVASLQSELSSLALKAVTSATTVISPSRTTTTTIVPTTTVTNTIVPVTTSKDIIPAPTQSEHQNYTIQCDGYSITLLGAPTNYLPNADYWCAQNTVNGEIIYTPSINNQIQNITSSTTAKAQTNTTTTTIVNTPTLTIGSIGKDVITLQQKLKSLGLLSGTIDGKYGKLTAAAVSQFQKANNLPQTGVADKSTMALIVIGPVFPSPIPLCRRTAPPSITVVSPNGGEVYTAGQQITVKWTSCNIPANALVTIQLNDSISQTSYTNTSFFSVNDGIEIITLPTNVSWLEMTYGMNFKLQVAQVVSSGTPPYDESNNLFTINAPVTPCLPGISPTSITVVSPNGGEVYTAGQQITVTWTSCNIPTTGYYIKANLFFNNIPYSAMYSSVPSVYSSMNFTIPDSSWFVPGFLQNGLIYKMQLTQVKISTGVQYAQDLSDNLFTINAQ